MNIQFLTRICPEAECIFLLERRFRPGMDAQNNIGQVRHYLSNDKYDIPPFELEPLLQPLAEVENYVNSNLSVSEERLRFFFHHPGQCPQFPWPGLCTTPSSRTASTAACPAPKSSAPSIKLYSIF